MRLAPEYGVASPAREQADVSGLLGALMILLQSWGITLTVLEALKLGRWACFSITLKSSDCLVDLLVELSFCKCLSQFLSICARKGSVRVPHKLSRNSNLRFRQFFDVTVPGIPWIWGCMSWLTLVQKRRKWHNPGKARARERRRGAQL